MRGSLALPQLAVVRPTCERTIPRIPRTRIRNSIGAIWRVGNPSQWFVDATGCGGFSLSALSPGAPDRRVDTSPPAAPEHQIHFPGRTSLAVSLLLQIAMALGQKKPFYLR